MSNVISVQELKKLLQDHSEEVILVDVRTPEKHHAYNIGGKLIPLDKLPQRFTELDKTKTIITYCTSGGRSMHALHYLAEQGYTSVKSLEGGMTAWKAEE